MNKGGKRLFIGVSIGILVLIGLGVAGYFYVNQKNASDEADLSASYQERARDVQGRTIDSNAAYAQLVDKYGSSYERVLGEVISSKPAEWDSTMVEKTYFLIAFSRQSASYRTIEILLGKLDEASKAGVSIVIAEIDANEAYRNELRAEIDDAMKNPDQRPTQQEASE